MNKNWQEWLSSDQRGWRLFVSSICVICLALFLHFREVRVEVLELNKAASQYVVAQVDFEFPDYEATIILRQQAIKDIGAIYQINHQQIHEARYLLEEDLIHNRDWRSAAPASTFEEMYKSADEIETLLLEARFTDPRTIQKVKDLGLCDASYFEFIPENPSAPGLLPAEFWDKISSTVLQKDTFHQETIDYIVSSFKKHSWHLAEASTLEKTLRSSVAKTIPEKMTKVLAGTRMIDQGEKVTSRHISMMQSMKQAISDSRKIWDPLTIIASLLLALIFVTISALYLRIAQPAFTRSLRELSLFVSIIIATLLFAKGTEYLLLKSTSNILEAVRYPIVVPFATILICILLSARSALFAATFLSIILSVSLAVDHSRFLILNLVASIVVIISCEGVRKRKEVFSVCVKSWLSSILVLVAFAFSEGHFVSYALLIDIFASAAFLLITAILVVGLLPALEIIFGVLTDMTLMESMDPNNELLRQFAVEVPGTYQHSLVLGHLAEACASAIHANGLFCRAATLYHDIGKMNNPQFYTENQQGNINIHQLLTPIESAQVIISHVTEGEAMARKAGLPQPFIDIIREHHGTTLVYYFYRKQLDLKGGNAQEVDASLFRYPGPKPRSKESAIIMICDTVEAASRSVEEVNEEKLMQLVDRLVSEKADDGQFDHCQLTFEELRKVKKTLVSTLLLSSHIRIKYPKRDRH